MTAPTLLALDVTAAARAAGVSTPGRIAVSAGVLAGLKDPDDSAAVDAFVGPLARLVLEGGYPRRKLDDATELVDVGGRSFALLGRSDAGGQCFAIVAPIELSLAGTAGVTLDVKTRAAPTLELLQ